MNDSAQSQPSPTSVPSPVISAEPSAAHTPGPWEVDENGLAGYGDNGPNFSIVQSGETRYGHALATLNFTHRLLDYGPTDEYEEAAANARLIAAAPELLAALQSTATNLRKLSGHFERHGFSGLATATREGAEDCESAIAKALGPSAQDTTERPDRTREENQ